jgi:predicted nucleic acid-binding protein
VEDLICLDSDVIIDHLGGRGPGVGIFEEVVKKKVPFTTHINRFELLCGARDKGEVAIINECLLGFTVLPFDRAGSEVASRVYTELKRRGRMVGVRDIMIAGVVLANNLMLATKNVKDFKVIKGLRILET